MMTKQPVFDGAMPYIWRGEVEGGVEADPEKQLQSSEYFAPFTFLNHRYTGTWLNK